MSTFSIGARSVALTAVAASVTAIALAAAGAQGGRQASAAGPHDAARVATLARPVAPVSAARPGAGWAVATWSRTADSSGTLFLIDPAGHRRAVASVSPHATPVLWSPDGERVLVTSDTGTVQIALRSGHATRVKLPEDARLVDYSRPRGVALLAATSGSDPGTHLARFGLDGRHQQDYPRSVTGAGLVAPDAALENHTGTEVVVGADRGIVVLRNNGTVVRRLLASKRDCAVSSWWHFGVALASCRGTLWAVPTSGAKATRISAAPSKPNPFGYSTAWRYGRGTLGLAPNGCGPQSLVRFGSDGTGARLTVPQPIAKAGTPRVVGHGGDRVLLTVSPGAGCMSGATTLFAYDAVTNRSKALLGPAVNSGTVQGAIAYPAD